MQWPGILARCPKILAALDTTLAGEMARDDCVILPVKGTSGNLIFSGVTFAGLIDEPIRQR